VVVRKILKDEKDISAIEQEKEKQTWFPRKDVNSQWKKSD